MKKKIAIIIFLLIPFLPEAQVVFITEVPQQQIVSGESFQVQYILSNAERVINFQSPPFSHFRFVSGPNLYDGSVEAVDGIQSIRNFVYTLQALVPGRFVIPGAVAIVNGKQIKSNNVFIEVISKKPATQSFQNGNASINSDDILMTGEDPYKKIKQNLFLKLEVNRTTCFAGEPILAVFKLYSRLESNSDIVKNPGFYGFTVYDMVNLADNQMSSETLNGKIFDVHTIRKVQLYPLQAGTFTIDAMEVKNEVKFSRSYINKKPEQEIAEGILGNNDAVKENTEVFENSMHTEPVIIHVKSLPTENKPPDFNGTVGNFSISTVTGKSKLAKNEDGFFEIKISGNGNFTQLNTPAINWPSGIEGFEPVITDSLDKSKFPLAGSRTFRYPFISNHSGLYQLPSVNLSFFEPGSNSFRKVSSTVKQVEISNEEIKNIVRTEKKESIANKNARTSKIAVGIIISLFIVVLIYWVMRKEKPVLVVSSETKPPLSVDDGLSRLSNTLYNSNPEFYEGLQQFIWKYFENHFRLDASMANKEILFSKLRIAGVKDEIVLNLDKILTVCEMGIFANATLEINKEDLLKETKYTLEVINHSLF